VKAIVASHWHDDHWVASAELASAWPAAQFIAHPFTAQLMETREDKLNGAACIDPLASQVKPLREQLASGKHEDGTPISDKGKAFLRVEISGFDQSIVECGEARLPWRRRGFDLSLDRPRWPQGQAAASRARQYRR
jgi:hypothetical protein